jgi:hypothetical protein
MATREQAMLIGRNQRIAKQRQALFAAIEAGQLPMDTIMDPRLPLTDSERQNTWNQMAANQWSGRQAVLRGEGETASPAGEFLGTPNQFQQSVAILQRSPEWQTMGEEGRVKTLQRMFGTEVATRYASALKDRAAVETQRRKTFDDKYETQRALERERLQAGARLASTEPEMLHRNLMSGDWVVRSNGVFERNPQYNPNNPLTAELPPYLPLNPSGEATIARHWQDVMPGRPNPLNPEKLMAIQIGEENPDLSAEEIAKAAKGRLAAISAARANPARAIADMEESQALQRIAARQGAIPTSPAALGYDVERTSPIPPAAAIPSGPSTNEPMRFGEQLRQFGINAARGITSLVPETEARLGTLGRFIERGGFSPEVGQFFNDVLGRPTSPLPAPVVPVAPSQTQTYRTLPDWLK